MPALELDKLFVKRPVADRPVPQKPLAGVAHPQRHYHTFQESVHSPAQSHKLHMLDDDFPSRSESLFGQCEHETCRFVFLSADDKDRHDCVYKDRIKMLKEGYGSKTK